jgi:ribosomal protein S27AE
VAGPGFRARRMFASVPAASRPVGTSPRPRARQTPTLNQPEESKRRRRIPMIWVCALCASGDDGCVSTKYPYFHIRCVAEIGRERTKQKRGPASALVLKAIRKGVLPPLDGSVACVDCGRVALMYDHRDYNAPLSVSPVCGRCNWKRGAGTPLNSYRDPYAHLQPLLNTNPQPERRRTAKPTIR